MEINIHNIQACKGLKVENFKTHIIINLKRHYHDEAAKNGYIVTAAHSREICDVTNEDVLILLKWLFSRHTVVKLTTEYFMLETDS